MGRDRDGLELWWPGKYDETGRRTPLPRRAPRTQLLEAYRASARASVPERGADALWVGDNLDVLDALADELAGAVDLVVLDPPFGTGNRFNVVSRVGEAAADGKVPQVTRPAYDDRWTGGASGLVAMLDPRLRFIHRMLADTGSLYLHLDATVVHAVKLLLDEIFGEACFQRQIVWRIGWVSGFKTRAKNWIRNHDVILFYTKDPRRFVFDKQYVPHPPGYLRRDGKPPRGPGMPISDVWNATAIEAELTGSASLDSIQIKSFSTEKTGYATQKNESLVRRIVQTSSRPGDLVADFFCGSGTTLAVARSLGRRVLGADVGRAAIAITKKRLLAADPEAPLSVWSTEQWARRRDPTSAEAALRRRAPKGAAVVGDVATDADLPPARRGRASVVAWGYRLAAPVAEAAGGVFEVGGVGQRPHQLWIGHRALLDPRTVDDPDAVTPWPRLRARLVFADRDLVVELVGIDDPDLPADVAALEPSPRDLVDAWTVDFSASDAVRATGLRARGHQRRALETTWPAQTLGGRGPWTIRIVAWDVLHRRAELEITVDRRGGRMLVTEAWSS